MEISVNTKGLNSLVKPKITTTVSDLASARNNLTGLKMPENFSKASQLNNIQNRISQVEKNVSEINSYIDDKVKDFEDAERKASQSVNNLEKTLAKLGTGLGGGMFGNLGQKNTTKLKKEINMTNNLDYEYYMKTQGKNKNANSPSLFLFLEPYLEQKYAGTMASIRSTKIPSLINFTIAGIKGISKAGETTSKGFNINQANSISNNNPEYDYYFNGDVRKINAARDMYRKETMARVSINLTQSVYNNFYENTKLGKWLEKNAGQGFKANQGGTNLAESLGYMGTMMAAGKTTLGTAILTYLSKKGEGAQSYWSQEEIQSQIKYGKNLDKIWNVGNTYGNIKGGWAAVSYGLQKATGAGGVVDKYLNYPVLRVFIDADIAAIDGIVAPLANSVATGKDFYKAIEDNGGIEGILTNIAVATIVSGAGEFARYKFNNVDIDEKFNRVDTEKALNTAKANQKKFWAGYFSEEEIDEKFEKITIYSDEEWRELDYIKQNPTCLGYCNVDGDGDVHISERAIIYMPGTIEHETNHALGNVNYDIRRGRRAMNEATTEMFALDATGDSSNGISKYSYNVGILRKIKKMVDEKVHNIPGYEDTDLLKLAYSDNTVIEDMNSYDVDTKSLFEDAIDDIMDEEGYSKKILRCMIRADGGSYNQFSKQEIEESRKELTKIVNEIRTKINEDKSITQELTSNGFNK